MVETPEIMCCLSNMKDPDPVDMQNSQKVWFGEVSSNLIYQTFLNCKCNFFQPLLDDSCVDGVSSISLESEPLPPSKPTK